MADRLPTPEDAQIGRRLKALRIELGLEAQDIAAKLNMTAGNFAHYEKGRNRLAFVDVARFADALGVEPTYLIERLGLRSVLLAEPTHTTPATRAAQLLAQYPELSVQLAQVADDLEEDDLAFLTEAVKFIRRKRDPGQSR